MRLLVPLDDDAALDPARVGLKFVSLARAHRQGFPVPRAVAVATAAHRLFRERAAFPEDLARELPELARELGLEGGGLSVRSSATLEDLDGRSFAGVYDTFLNVRSQEELRRRIRDCWVSAEAEVVRGYLAQSGLAGEAPAMGVILQRMVHAAAAGVAFSRNPLHPERDEVVVEGVEGLGEKLVSGRVTPCRVFVRGSGEVEVDGRAEAGDGSRPPLAEEHWRRIAELAREVETRFAAGPQDVEWAADGERRIWLLQARPITTLEEGAATDVPAGAWTRRIAVDLWADRLTPFLGGVMVANAPRFDFSRTSRAVGIPVVQPALAVVDGYLYVNCESLQQLLTILPRSLRIPDLRDLFPPGFELEAVPPPGPGRLTAFALRAALLGLRSPRANPLLCLGISRRGLARLRRRLRRLEALPCGTPAAALARVRAAVEVMAQLQERNQWPYYYATVTTLVLRWLVVDRAGRGHADFLALLSGGARNVTAEIEHRFRQLAATVRRGPELAARFESEEPEDLAATLPEPLAGELAAFLARYGCRGRHRALTVERWAERPGEVVAMLATLARREETRRPSGATGAPEVAEARAALPWGTRLLLGPLRRLSRSYLDLREDLRFALDEILFALRRALLGLGEATGLGDSVFFLTDGELGGAVSGELSLEAARERARRRRRRFRQAAAPPDFYLGGRPVDDLTAELEELVGVGTSPGRVVGRARIVSDPTRVDLADGDVLVAANTDPGWTPVLSAVGAVVVEEGGLLNHCSIVARELGIPAVVGVRGATRRIPEGARITVDGDRGTVRIQPD